VNVVTVRRTGEAQLGRGQVQIQEGGAEHALRAELADTKRRLWKAEARLAEDDGDKGRGAA
jgi:hypothetical protein